MVGPLRVWLLLTAALTGVVAASTPARATVVVGSFSLSLIDFIGEFTVPPPLSIGSPGPTTGRFTYDTAAASPSVSPDGLSGRYTLLQSAALSITFNSETYSTTASPTNPIQVRVAGGTNGDNFFGIAPIGFFGVTGGFVSGADPTNPLAAFPALELMNGSGALPNGTLPTSSVSAGLFPDHVAFLESEVPRGSGFYSLRFLVTSDVVITPRPGAARPQRRDRRGSVMPLGAARPATSDEPAPSDRHAVKRRRCQGRSDHFSKKTDAARIMST